LYDIHTIDITPVMSTVQHSGTSKGITREVVRGIRAADSILTRM